MTWLHINVTKLWTFTNINNSPKVIICLYMWTDCQQALFWKYTQTLYRPFIIANSALQSFMTKLQIINSNLKNEIWSKAVYFACDKSPVSWANWLMAVALYFAANYMSEINLLNQLSSGKRASILPMNSYFTALNIYCILPAQHKLTDTVNN